VKHRHLLHKPIVCCLSDPDRQALTDLVSPLAYRPALMSEDWRRAVIGDEHRHTVCTVCGKLRVRCVGGCDLIPVTVWKVPD
jgi:hypothetical protein